MASVAEQEQEDCQMQPLDLSCPKVRRQSDTSEGGESPPGFPRPRSSSGGSDESAVAADFRRAALQNWALAFPSVLVGGPARKRFLTKYLHKDTGKFDLSLLNVMAVIFYSSLYNLQITFAENNHFKLEGSTMKNKDSISDRSLVMMAMVTFHYSGLCF